MKYYEICRQRERERVIVMDKNIVTCHSDWLGLWNASQVMSIFLELLSHSGWRNSVCLGDELGRPGFILSFDH